MYVFQISTTCLSLLALFHASHPFLTRAAQHFHHFQKSRLFDLGFCELSVHRPCDETTS